MNLWPKKKKPVPPKKTPKSQASGRIPREAKDRCQKMGSLLLEAEITGKECLGQLKAGAGGGANDKKQYKIQIEKVNDSTKVHVCA